MANEVITVLEADGVTQTNVTVLDVGRQAAIASKSLVLSTEDKTVLDAIATSLAVLDDWDVSDKCNVVIASGGVASGAIASGAVASGAIASGAVASGAIASGAIAAGAIAAGATSIAENEDVASADGDRGIKVLFKRLDSPANASGTSGDYEQPQMAAGRIWTSSTIDAAIPAGGNNIGDVDVLTFGGQTPAYGSGAVGATVIRVAPATDSPGLYTEDAASAADPIGHMMMAVRRDTLVTSEVSATGDNIAAKATSKGQLHVYAEIDSTQVSGAEYETVAASQTAQILGPTGATGDFITGLLVIPATTSPGNVLLLDNATSITVFTGGASSVSNLVPFYIPLGMFSVSGAWKVTTGASVSVIGIGNFT